MKPPSATRMMRLTTAIVAALTIGCGSSTNPTERWVDNWCQVRITMTPGEAATLMGDPTRQHLTGAGAFMQWDYREYQFTAFIGTDGRLRQLDINTDELTATQVKAIGCGVTRRNTL